MLKRLDLDLTERILLMKWIVFLLFSVATVCAYEAHPVWPDLAPGESTKHQGKSAPYRADEVPPVLRVSGITQPTFTVHLAPQPGGAGVVILPGGGFGKVVPNKEGTEAAGWLNSLGISAFVLSYRTTSRGDDLPGWNKPVQDAQRLLSLVRSRASEWGLKQDRIGLLGFSAGGQVAARVLSAEGKASYVRVDEADEVSGYPNFAMLVYPWNVCDPKTGKFVEGVTVPKTCPPTFLVHTDDDNASSLSSAMFYVGLKKQGIPAELHIYGNGGHGYGLRPIKGSEIATWTQHAGHWLGRLLE